LCTDDHFQLMRRYEEEDMTLREDPIQRYLECEVSMKVELPMEPLEELPLLRNQWIRLTEWVN